MPNLTTRPGAPLRFVATCERCSAFVKSSNGTSLAIDAGDLVPTNAPGKYLLTAIHIGFDDFTITLFDEDNPASSVPRAVSNTGRELTSLTYVVAG